LEQALEAAARFARNPPVAMALIKSALNTANDTVERAIAAEADYQSVLMNTEDHAEAVKAFMEKRKPEFRGR
jgi:2-(1,2-epoxy-1,2-dihydrophenyl)acetyl-CoA isomerase